MNPVQAWAQLSQAHPFYAQGIALAAGWLGPKAMAWLWPALVAAQKRLLLSWGANPEQIAQTEKDEAKALRDAADALDKDAQGGDK